MANKRIEIVVGSTSRHKLAAVHQACQRLGFGPSEITVQGRSTASGVNEQPVGFEETVTGAMNRAYGAAEDICHQGSHCLGIESGILTHDLVTVDLAVVALLTKAGFWFFSTTPGLRFPPDYVLEAQLAGWTTTTVGSIIRSKLGAGDGTDPHAVLTNGLLTRQETLVEGVRVALIQAVAAGEIEWP